jgi:hypothetical protein
VEPPESAGRDKPPCCDESTDLPPVLCAAVAEFVEPAEKYARQGADRHGDGNAAPVSLRIAPRVIFADRGLAGPPGSSSFTVGIALMHHNRYRIWASDITLCNKPGSLGGSLTVMTCRSPGPAAL